MIADDFQLPEMCITILRRDLRTFHGLFDHSKCTANLLEELLYRALQTYYGDDVSWNTRSHSSKADITLSVGGEILLLSIKSGKWAQGYLVISGYRLGRFNKDLDAINQFLSSNNHALMLAVPARKINSRWQYKLVYLKPSTFQYPTSFSDWVVKTGKTTNTQGKITAYEYISPNGVRMSIKTSMSDQIWWEIPATLIDNSVVINT